jgi:predicted TIM-barrel fold metal-dependent hydrolase
MVDVNVSLFRYPTRRVPHDDTGELVRFLKKKGVTQAWAGSFEGVLHRDLGGVNQRLAVECREHGDGLLLPFGTVDPLSPDWEEELRRCHEVHHMRGVRLFPNYHGYELDLLQFDTLIDQAATRNLIVQIAVRLEDPRTQHRLLGVPDVDLQKLKAVVTRHPTAKVVVLNALMSVAVDLPSALVEAGRVYFELAALEGVAGVTRLLASVPADRLLFGSHAPFFVWDAADLKLPEAALPRPVIEQIRAGNATKLLADAAE